MATSLHSYSGVVPLQPHDDHHVHIDFKAMINTEARLLPTFEQTYEKLDKELYHKGHGNIMESRKVGANTHLKRRPGNNIAVQLHSTDILTYYPDNRVIVNASTWYTMTTNQRMNAFLGWGTITSYRNVWHINVLIRLWDEGKYEWDKKATFAEAIIPFENGIAINARTHELMHSPNDYLTTLDDSLVMREISDMTRGLQIHARTLSDKAEKGTLVRDDLRTAVRHLDAFQQERETLVNKIKMLESGMDWATTELEETLTLALKQHADINREINELRHEVPGQGRMKDLL